MATPSKPRTRTFLAVALVALLAAGVFVVIKVSDTINRVNVVAYFDSSNGIFVGDDVVILGVPVGQIDKIEPEPERVKISFWYDSKYKVPADANAAILSPTLVTSRALQLTPVFTGGPVMRPRNPLVRRTAAKGKVTAAHVQRDTELAGDGCPKAAAAPPPCS